MSNKRITSLGMQVFAVFAISKKISAISLIFKMKEHDL